MPTVDDLLAAQRALRSRFDDLRAAFERDDATAAAIALSDFELHLRRWTAAEEESLVPALERATIEGRDPRRELRLEFVQLRELAGIIVAQIDTGVRPSNLTGYVDNLDRRLAMHEKGLASVYFPRAANAMTDEEWQKLLAAAPPP